MLRDYIRKIKNKYGIPIYPTRQEIERKERREKLDRILENYRKYAPKSDYDITVEIVTENDEPVEEPEPDYNVEVRGWENT